MFTHLTGQARRVMQMAHQEALDRNHDYVGTEHVLMAMLRDGDGVAARVLEACGVALNSLRQELDGELEAGAHSLDLEKLPLTGAVQRMLRFAREEADAMHKTESGLEHLLLGILREEECQAAVLLDHHGVTMEQCRAEIARTVLEPNRDHLIQTSLPAIPGVGRDPTALELEERISREVLPREWRPDSSHLPSAALVRSLEAQVRGTQLVLGAFLGGFAMVEMYGWSAMFGGALIGLLLAGFQSSILGALFGGICGFFVGFQYGSLGAWVVVCATILGFFIGSWLGNVWRLAVPPAKEKRDLSD